MDKLMKRCEKLMRVLGSMRENRPTLCHKIGNRMTSLNRYEWAMDMEYKPWFYNEKTFAAEIERIEEDVIIWTQEFLERKVKS